MQLEIAKIVTSFIFSLALITSCQQNALNSEISLAIGTYTKKEDHVEGKAKGVYLAKLDTVTGLVTVSDTIPDLINPSYLTIVDSILYAVNELADESNPGIGELTAVNLNDFTDRYSTKVLGNAPCHVLYVDRHDKLIVSSYMGVVSLVGLEPNLILLDTLRPSGLSVGTKRQSSSHPHMAMLAPDGNTILVSDLGLDVILHLKIEEDSLIEIGRTKVSSGGGPRHMASDSTEMVYVLNELSNEIEVFKWIAPGQKMWRVQKTSTLENPMLSGQVNCAAIKLHPNGKFLYASNRGLKKDGEQSISLLRVGDKGKLTFIKSFDTRGMVPRDFEVTPYGKHLLVANQNSDNIITYEINPKTGALIYCGKEAEVKTPVCLKFYKL